MKLVAPLILLSAVLFIDLHQRHGATADKCSRTCKPLVQEMIHCDDNTGECSEGCITGYYGKTCDDTCECEGGACDFVDGTCMDVSTVTPVLASPGNKSDKKDCNKAVDPLVVCCLCLLVVIIMLLIIVICKEKIQEKCHGKHRPQKEDEEKRKMLSDDHMMTDSHQNQPLTASQRDFLVETLGVHFLNLDERRPVILFCIHMKYDISRINTKQARLNHERILVNEPGEGGIEEVPERFKKFSGTTSLSPTFHGDSPTYWEVHNNVGLRTKLQVTDKLFCFGMCREKDRDTFYQVPSKPYCYNLCVGFCDSHKGICSKICRDQDEDKCSDEKTDMRNVESASGELKYGILVYKGKGVIIFFDALNMKRLHCLKNVNFEKPLWPMFGVFGRSPSSPSVGMKLVTGRDIEMSSRKKDMILNALSSV